VIRAYRWSAVGVPHSRLGPLRQAVRSRAGFVPFSYLKFREPDGTGRIDSLDATASKASGGAVARLAVAGRPAVFRDDERRRRRLSNHAPRRSLRSRLRCLRRRASRSEGGRRSRPPQKVAASPPPSPRPFSPPGTSAARSDVTVGWPVELNRALTPLPAPGEPPRGSPRTSRVRLRATTRRCRPSGGGHGW